MTETKNEIAEGYKIIQRTDRVTVLDLQTAQFCFQFLIENNGGDITQYLKIPFEFDLKGQHSWRDVILSDSIRQLSPVAGTLQFVKKSDRMIGSQNDREIQGYIPILINFVDDNPVNIQLTFETQFAFSDMPASDFLYVDIFAPTGRVTAEILGAGFPIHLLPIDEESDDKPLRVELLYDGNEDGTEASRAMKGFDTTSPDCENRILWTWDKPKNSHRYKIFFQAQPPETALESEPDYIPLTPKLSLQLDNLMWLEKQYFGGYLNEYQGKYVFAEKQQLLVGCENEDLHEGLLAAEQLALKNGFNLEAIADLFVSIN